jgi:hypothetical protein
MYYILNETNKIIAADESVLSLCGVTHIDELVSGIIKGDIIFDFTSDEHILIKTENANETYTLTKTSLSSMLGELTLVTLSNQEEEVASLSPVEDIMIDSSIIEDDIHNSDIIDSTISSEEEILEETEEKEDISSLILENIDKPIAFDYDLSLDNDNNDDIMHLKETTEEETKVETNTEKVDNLEVLENEPLELKLDNDDLFLEEEKTDDSSEININVEEISQKIGISTDDYNTFLNDFIDTALELEKDLQSNDDDTRTDAIGTLSHLGKVLHLPVVGDILTKITQTNNDNQRKEIESLYSTLSRITTSVSTEKEVEEKILEEDIPEIIEEEKLEVLDTPKIIDAPSIQEEINAQKSSNAKGFGTISLEGIKPKHFDFQLEEAANDLSLPVELIEEFVHDFIDQAHIETKKILEAYEKGDLDAIQKIGHLLKGAASNLRINPLSDTLYKIQFCEDTNNLETLIKDYWAHFLSFETQINVISN